MAEKMILQQVRDTLASWLGGSEACLDTCNVALLESMVSACDAHLAGMGEPVAWLAADGSGRVIDVKAKSAGARASATASATSVYSIPLYAAPPIDLAAVREATQDIREWCDMYIGGGNLPPLVENLEAAIKGGA